MFAFLTYLGFLSFFKLSRFIMIASVLAHSGIILRNRRGAYVMTARGWDSGLLDLFPMLTASHGFWKPNLNTFLYVNSSQNTTIIEFKNRVGTIISLATTQLPRSIQYVTHIYQSREGSYPLLHHGYTIRIIPPYHPIMMNTSTPNP